MKIGNKTFCKCKIVFVILLIKPKQQFLLHSEGNKTLKQYETSTGLTDPTQEANWFNFTWIVPLTGGLVLHYCHHIPPKIDNQSEGIHH